MSIETIAEVNWNGTIDSTNKIGISDTLDNLSVDVWSDASVFVTACYNKWCKFRRFTTSYPVTNSETNECPWYLKVNTGYTNIDNNNNEDIYYRSVLLAVPLDYNYSNWNAGTGGRLRSDASTIRIITSLSVIKNNIDVILNKNGNVVTSAVYTVNENIPETTATGTFTYDGANYRIICADIFTDGTDFFVNVPTSPPFNVYDSPGSRGVMGAWCYDVNGNKMMSLSPQIFEEDEKTFSIGSSGGYYNLGPWNNHELPSEVDEVFYATFDRIGTTWHLDSRSNEYYHLMNVSRFGLKFKYDNDDYKPIIAQGVVTGYTTDMTVPSDIDNWTDISGHNISPTPPPPVPPGPGYDDDPWSGVSFSGVGLGGGGAFARCYYMTSTELANLRTWMSGVGVPEGFNPMAQIIGLSQVPVALSGDAPETVQFINSSAVYDPGITSRIVDSNVSTQYSMGGPIKYSLGSVDIVRRMQERGEPYLDYSCQIELYLPLIGMFSLDTQAVMGRTIEAEAILDPISGTLAAYAWVSKDGHKLPVAYGSTTISVDLPVTAQQYSVSKAALKQANAQLGTSILSSVATLVAAAVGGGKAEGSNARVSGGASSMQGARGMNSYAQASSIAASQAAISQTGNIVGDFMQWGRTIKQLQYGNNTAISGSFGGSVAQWSYPFQAYVKINRPRYEKPENYAHTQGVPCVQKKRIGDCTGFIQCIGVDVDNHIEGATDLERQAIQAALSSGIYAGGGGE